VDWVCSSSRSGFKIKIVSYFLMRHLLVDYSPKARFRARSNMNQLQIANVKFQIERASNLQSEI
jgi:hypothetical protein